jgi:hypothetical protein
MNDKTKLAISLAVGTGFVAHTLLDSLKTHRREQAKREQIKHDSDLDLAAIRRAGDRFAEEVQTGIHDNLSLGEMLVVLNRRIEFERITIRLED